MILGATSSPNDDPDDHSVVEIKGAQNNKINGKNVWGIRMFGTPAGADTEWATRTQAYVTFNPLYCVHAKSFFNTIFSYTRIRLSLVVVAGVMALHI